MFPLQNIYEIVYVWERENVERFFRDSSNHFFRSISTKINFEFVLTKVIEADTSLIYHNSNKGKQKHFNSNKLLTHIYEWFRIYWRRKKTLFYLGNDNIRVWPVSVYLMRCFSQIYICKSTLTKKNDIHSNCCTCQNERFQLWQRTHMNRFILRHWSFPKCMHQEHSVRHLN